MAINGPPELQCSKRHISSYANIYVHIRTQCQVGAKVTQK